MKIFFYSNHTLYAKVLIPLIVKLSERRFDISIYKNKPDLFKYSPRLYANTPISNTFVNRGSFNYVAGLIGYEDEWGIAENKVRYTFLCNPDRYDCIIGTTKDLERLSALKEKNPDKKIVAVGYQHMPFTLCVGGKFERRNLPEGCIDIFTKENIFSRLHRFPEYISGREVSFRGFPYLEKVYKKYYSGKEEGQSGHVLIFHPGGYRNVITKPGDNKKISYENQRDFLSIICRPILEKGLTPVIKIHPLAARYHFEEDVREILHDLSKERGDFSNVIVETNNYFKYAYKSDAIVTFGSSGIYELFSIGAKNIIICGFFGKARSDKFSFLKGIFLDSIDLYNDFWKKERKNYFLNAYEKDPMLEKIYRSYSSLFSDNISENVLEDAGL